eukprot:GHUV01008549.1.p1 GENE.GHUV01008549.1~~GHUV01008549.1.p1  ORF type:complete len:208 (+),score=81.07 GHUV01008549.1:587-1210(+)
MDYFKRVFGASNTSSSSAADPGIITVHPSSTAPSQQQRRSQTNITTSVTDVTDPLLLHLQELTAQQPAGVKDLPVGGNSSSSSSKAADADSLLADVELVKQLGQGTGPLTDAVGTLLSSYHLWHTEHLAALTSNQDYINRTMDLAEAKASKAVKHVQLQTIRLRTVAAGLSAAEGLPAVLANVTAATAQLEQQLKELEQLATDQEQQ